MLGISFRSGRNSGSWQARSSHQGEALLKKLLADFGIIMVQDRAEKGGGERGRGKRGGAKVEGGWGKRRRGKGGRWRWGGRGRGGGGVGESWNKHLSCSLSSKLSRHFLSHDVIFNLVFSGRTFTRGQVIFPDMLASS